MPTNCSTCPFAAICLPQVDAFVNRCVRCKNVNLVFRGGYACQLPWHLTGTCHVAISKPTPRGYCAACQARGTPLGPR